MHETDLTAALLLRAQKNRQTDGVGHWSWTRNAESVLTWISGAPLKYKGNMSHCVSFKWILIIPFCWRNERRTHFYGNNYVRHRSLWWSGPRCQLQLHKRLRVTPIAIKVASARNKGPINILRNIRGCERRTQNNTQITYVHLIRIQMYSPSLLLSARRDRAELS